MTKLVTPQQLADAIGRTPQRVRQLRKAGIIGGFRNCFDLWPSVADFASYTARSKHAGRPSVSDVSAGCVQSIFDF
jgi:hypothetical protein